MRPREPRQSSGALGLATLLLGLCLHQPQPACGMPANSKDRPISISLAEEPDGWFGAYNLSGHLMRTLGRAKVSGAVAEIGIWEGKSFIHLLRHSRPGLLDTYLAIDRFRSPDPSTSTSTNVQAENAHLRMFERNLERLASPRQRGMVQILQASSTDLTPADILTKTGGKRVAFFSVDGCHKFKCVASDLQLALDTLHEQGLIMIDDYFNYEYPGVSLAVGEFLRAKEPEMVAVAYGLGKFFVCGRQSAAFWLEAFDSFCGGEYCTNDAGPCKHRCRRHESGAPDNPVTAGYLIQVVRDVYG